MNEKQPLVVGSQTDQLHDELIAERSNLRHRVIELEGERDRWRSLFGICTSHGWQTPEQARDAQQAAYRYSGRVLAALIREVRELVIEMRADENDPAGPSSGWSVELDKRLHRACAEPARQSRDEALQALENELRTVQMISGQAALDIGGVVGELSHSESERLRGWADRIAESTDNHMSEPCYACGGSVHPDTPPVCPSCAVRVRTLIAIDKLSPEQTIMDWLVILKSDGGYEMGTLFDPYGRPAFTVRSIQINDSTDSIEVAPGEYVRGVQRRRTATIEVEEIHQKART